MSELFGKVAEMQKKMAETQAALGKISVDVEVGGGMVKVTATGAQRITAIKLEPAVVNPDDMEMLEDLIIAGVNKALEEASRIASEQVRNTTGNMLGPGLNLDMLGL